MSGMDINQASIFHERQEPGSMLCAQHALNNLLQVPLYSASELANIAHELDVLEAAQLDDGEGLADRMQNADDSGFFSVAVIEKALEVVNLRLVRWESADMRPYHSVPEDFSAFVLNFDKHWASLPSHLYKYWKPRRLLLIFSCISLLCDDSLNPQSGFST